MSHAIQLLAYSFGDDFLYISPGHIGCTLFVSICGGTALVVSWKVTRRRYFDQVLLKSILLTHRYCQWSTIFRSTLLSVGFVICRIIKTLHLGRSLCFCP